MSTSAKSPEDVLSGVPQIRTKAEVLDALHELAMTYATCTAQADEAHRLMRGLVEKYGDQEELSELQQAELKRHGVTVPVKRRLEDDRVSAMIYFKGLDPKLDEKKALAYLKQYHKDKLDALTTRELNVGAFEAEVKAGQIPSEVVAKMYKAPAPKAEFRVS